MLTTIALLTALVAPQGPQFEAPTRLMAGQMPVQVEAPGYAAPCFHDVDADGRKDLIVGQFLDGKMRVFCNLGTDEGGMPRFGDGEWLQAGGSIAQVPGVW